MGSWRIRIARRTMPPVVRHKSRQGPRLPHRMGAARTVRVLAKRSASSPASTRTRSSATRTRASVVQKLSNESQLTQRRRQERKRRRGEPLALSWAPGQSFFEAVSVGGSVGLDYQKRLERFRCFPESEALQTGDPVLLDFALVQFFDHRYFEGYQADDGHKRLAALAALPAAPGNLKNLLVRSQRALKGWKKKAPPESRAPVPWSLVVAMATALTSQGSWHSAFALLLAFVTYMRPSEVMQLEPQDFLPPEQLVGSWSVIIKPFDRLVPTKVGDYGDTVQFDTQVCKLFEPMIQHWIRLHPPGRRIFPEGSSWLASQMKMGARLIGAAELGLHPYQLRHGGPSFDRAEKLRTLDGIQKRGRRRASSSVRRYEKAGRAAQMLTKLSVATRTYTVSGQSTTCRACLRRFRRRFPRQQNWRLHPMLRRLLWHREGDRAPSRRPRDRRS